MRLAILRPHIRSDGFADCIDTQAQGVLYSEPLGLATKRAFQTKLRWKGVILFQHACVERFWDDVILDDGGDYSLQ